MKEKYISPELELLCLAPAERLASDTSEVDFDMLMGEHNTGVSVNPEVDIDIPIIY